MCPFQSRISIKEKLFIQVLVFLAIQKFWNLMDSAKKVSSGFVSVFSIPVVLFSTKIGNGNCRWLAIKFQNEYLNVFFLIFDNNLWKRLSVFLHQFSTEFLMGIINVVGSYAYQAVRNIRLWTHEHIHGLNSSLLGPQPRPEGSYKIGSVRPVCPSICLSFRLSVSFLRIGSLAHFLKLSMVLGAHI